MNSINIKKAATVAVGAAMLAGAALAVEVPSDAAEKGFYWDEDGNVNTQLVLGSEGKAIDGVQAAKFAAFLGKNAYTETGDEGGTKVIEGSEIDVDCSVTVEQSSGSVSLPEESVKQDIPWGDEIDVDNFRLLLTTSQGMRSGTVDFDGNEYDYEESAGLPPSGGSNVTLGYSEDDDYHGVYFSDINSDQFYYEFEFLDAFPTDQEITETVTIPFLGEEYVINEIDTSEIELVKGTKIDLGVGGKEDISIGNETYTITLQNVGYSQQASKGTATVEVVRGTDSESVKLDAGESTTVLGGLTIYVQSTEESYVTGIQGTATLRVGGEALTLSDGEVFPGDDRWEVELSLDSSNDLDKILLYYDVDVDAEDEVTSIEGPNGYFYLDYLGTQIDPNWNDWETEEMIIKGGEQGDDDEGVITDLTFTEDDYQKTFNIELNDDDETKAYLANASGFIGNSVGGATELEVGDIFFVDDTPVYIRTITTPSDPTSSTLKLIVGKGDVNGNEVTKEVSGSDKDGNTSRWVWVNDYSILGTSVDLNWTYNPAGDEKVKVTDGADDVINTRFGTIDWTHLDNSTARTLGPANVTVVANEGAGTNLAFNYVNSSDNPGIRMKIGGNVKINQGSSNADDEDNMYEWGSDYRAEALSGSEIKVWLPENTPLEKRVTLTRSAINLAGEEGTMTYNYDDVPAGVVTNMTCMANDKTITVPSGVLFGETWSLSNLVITDTQNPAGNAVVLGGHYVNQMASGTTDDHLTAAGDAYVARDGNMVYVAGYTGDDTSDAVDDLIDAIKANM